MSERSEGVRRREKLLAMLLDADRALSGSALAKELGVSRQVIVQDIALLRAHHTEILSTSRGYRIMKKGEDGYFAQYRVKHNREQIQEELNIIVDSGAIVWDVSVEHSVYGEVRADLYLGSRRAVKEFLNKLNQPEAVPLLEIGKGIHSHWVKADEPEILDEIEQELKEAGFLLERRV